MRAAFYTIFNLAPDTYTIDVAAVSYHEIAIAGVNVVQDQTLTLDERLEKSLRTIGRTTSRGAGNLDPVSGQTVFDTHAQLRAPRTMRTSIFRTISSSAGKRRQGAQRAALQ